MHELGIAEATLNAIERQASRYPGARVVSACVCVGELAGVDPAALRFAFEAITQGTAFEAMRLEIEFSPRKQKCAVCKHEFLVCDYNLQCPQCHNQETSCIGGEELDLAFVEVEEHATS
jgi:hydrogenase nickel incorporation protein HypA/HybF